MENRKRVIVAIAVLLIAIVQNLLGQEKDTAIGSPKESGDWGISGSLGGPLRGIGLSVLTRQTSDLTILAGLGFLPHIDLHLDLLGEDPTNEGDKYYETRLSTCVYVRYFALGPFYLLGGAGAQMVHGSVRAHGEESQTTLGSVGIPIAVGIETGRGDGPSVSAEIGSGFYVGPGADDVELTLHSIDIIGNPKDYRTTLNGSSGLFFGVALNYYF